MSTATQTETVEKEENDSMMNDKWYSLRIGSDPLFSDPSTFFINVDTKNKILILVYFVIFILSYLICQMYYYHMTQNGDDLACDLFQSLGSSFFAYDMIFMALVMAIFIATDFWKMGFSIYSYILFLIFSLVVAICITMPLYLAMRVSRRCKIDNDYKRPQKEDINCCKSFIPITIYIILMIFFLIGPTGFKEPALCEE